MLAIFVMGKGNPSDDTESNLEGRSYIPEAEKTSTFKSLGLWPDSLEALDVSSTTFSS